MSQFTQEIARDVQKSLGVATFKAIKVALITG